MKSKCYAKEQEKRSPKNAERPQTLNRWSFANRIPREETLNGKRQKHLKENKRQKVRNQELCPSREIRNRMRHNARDKDS